MVSSTVVVGWTLKISFSYVVNIVYWTTSDKTRINCLKCFAFVFNHAGEQYALKGNKERRTITTEVRKTSFSDLVLISPFVQWVIYLLIHPNLISLIILNSIWQFAALSPHLDSLESRKTYDQNFIFQIGTLNPHGINERFSFN